MSPVDAFLLGVAATLGGLACLVAYCAVKVGARSDRPTLPASQPHVVVVDCHDGCALAAEVAAIRALPEAGQR